MHPIVRLQDGGDKCATGAKTTIRVPKEETTIETWTVRCQPACRKAQELSHQLQCYQWDILGLAKVRWTGFGETTTDEGHKIWNCGEDLKHQYGVAFIVRKENACSIISCTPISSRLISIRISARPYNISHSMLDHEQFYEKLDNIIAKTHKNDILVVHGDWNAKVGADTYQHWAGPVGRFGIGQTNDGG